ncbi:MAG: hypothetical protein J6K29_07640, partial [Clostridia bacterium]|nr:hypothetical protein [Clostridia bacterium]
TAERWMRRVNYGLVSGIISLGVSRVLRIHPYERPNPLSSSTTCGGPPHPLADGTAWGRLTDKPTDKPKFEHNAHVSLPSLTKSESRHFG